MVAAPCHCPNSNLIDFLDSFNQTFFVLQNQLTTKKTQRHSNTSGSTVHACPSRTRIVQPYKIPVLWEQHSLEINLSPFPAISLQEYSKAGESCVASVLDSYWQCLKEAAPLRGST